MCTADGCERDVYAQGHCERHHRQVRRTGRVRPEPLATPRPECAAEGCARSAAERGFCHAHYQRVRRLGDARPGQPLRGEGDRVCSVPGCPRTRKARGLCKAHYARRTATGDARPDQPLRTPAADRHLSHGYWVVPVAEEERHLVLGLTSALEHRLVMARRLGRPLGPDESVHHRNGDRLDNREENLELWGRWQPSGQRVEDLVAEAVRILRLHRPQMLTLGE